MNNVLDLYEHNIKSYKKVKEAFDNGEKVVGIVHATGTGKSYNALQLAYDNKDKKITYIVPSVGIIEHIKNIIKEQNLTNDFSHVEFRTYQSFVNMSREDIEELEMDMLILDEFHHIGAPVWGNRIEQIIETHPDLLIFGMTAYTVRDRGTAYERDMADSSGNELFSNKIVSKYDLCDAMIDGVLPKPIYKTAYVNLITAEKELESTLNNVDKKSKDYIDCKKILDEIKKQIAVSPSLKDLIRKNVRPDGKFIYFCPPVSEDGKNDIKTIQKEAYEWFKEYVEEKDIIFYTSTSEMGEEGKKNREAFYKDKTLDGKSADGKLRIMFAINQYNEGIHAPNVDGVIMGRATSSDIVYYEQLGRSQAVRGETNKRYKELARLTKRDLLEICEQKDILLPNTIYKEEIIEKLLSPIVIDLTNNYGYIKELENDLKNRIKKIQDSKGKIKREIKLKDYNFDIEIENQNIFEMLQYVYDRLNKTWEDYYNLAYKYYSIHNDLEIPDSFKTINGYDFNENGINLGRWLSHQRQLYKKNRLSEERIALLQKIKMRFVIRNYEAEWNYYYDLAKKYYEKYKQLNFEPKFLKDNNVNEDISELKKWLKKQKLYFTKGKLKTERRELLESLGVIFNVRNNENLWQKNYNLASIYYEKHNNLEIPTYFKTIDGYTYNEKGVNLGFWIVNQRQNYKKGKLDEKRIKLLENIGMRFKTKNIDEEWLKYYNLAKNYFEKYSNLEVDWKFVTSNGYDYDTKGIKLGEWIHNQRRKYTNNTLSDYQFEMLSKIGMRFKTRDNEIEWQKYYEIAKLYYLEHGNLNVNYNYVVRKDNTEIKLGSWIARQKRSYNNDDLSDEKISLLNAIEMNFSMRNNHDSWLEHFELAKAYYEQNRNLNIKTNFRTNNGYIYDEEGFNLGQWIHNQRIYYKTGKLKKEKIDYLNTIGMVWDVKNNLEQIIDFCKLYNIDYDKNYEILKSISYETLKLKSDFLFSNNLALTINGQLSSIFSMNNIEMKSFYGVSLEDIINQNNQFLEESKMKI